MNGQPGELPADIAELLRRGDGVLRTSDAVAAGIERSRIHRLAKSGLLTRLIRGFYAATARVAELDPWELHKEEARAFAMLYGSRAFLTGWSAAVWWGLRTDGQPPRLPSVVFPKPSSRVGTTTSLGRVLVAGLPAKHRIRLRTRGEVLKPDKPGSWGAVSRSWAAADVARFAPVLSGLIVADSAVRKGADLQAVLPYFRRWEGASRARWVAGNADRNAESALETCGRFTCIEFDLPMPVSNAWVGRDGPEFRLDHLWPYHRCAGEADGALKYNNRDDAAKIVKAQNDREFCLRRLGLDFARYGWVDAYYRRRELAGKFASLLRDNPPRGEPIRWWKEVPGVGPVDPAPEDWPSPHPLGLILPAGWDVEQDELRKPGNEDAE